MSYVLENRKEFERLEKQSRCEAYNYKNELSAFSPKETGVILDAGCGSGIVSRFLAQKYSRAQIIGCDFSKERVVQASKKAAGIPNLNFQVEDLTHLTLAKNSVDAVVCRYVLEHLNEENRSNALSEFFRCIRPNGTICAVDIDGFLFNLFPQTELVEKVLSKIAIEKPFDLHVGRKIPKLLSRAGFANITWRIETHQFQGEELNDEVEQMKARFDLTTPFFNEYLGSTTVAEQFREEYLQCLKASDAVLFHNMFIVCGEKIGFKTEGGKK